MPQYFVRTVSDRVISVKADSYETDSYEVYNFITDGKIVASFNKHSVLAVIDEIADPGEFSAIGYEDDESSDLQEFLDSDEFFDAVYGIVEAWHEPDEDTQPEAEEPTSYVRPSVDPSYPIEHWKNEATKDEVWGFFTSKGFVHFYSEKSAQNIRDTQLLNLDDAYWSYLELTGYTKVED